MSSAGPSHGRFDGTRFSRLTPREEHSKSSNAGTRCQRLNLCQDVSSASETLRPHLSQVRNQIRETKRRGVMAFAISPRGFEGSLWLEASSCPRFAVVGRHSNCDLFLVNDDELALRHAAIVVQVVRGALCVRILDLASTRGMKDESERDIRCARGPVPIAVRLSNQWLYLFETGPNAADATIDSIAHSQGVLASAWRSIETALTERRAARRRLPRVSKRRGTSGTLVLRSFNREIEVPMDGDALVSGVLLGRYERCLGGALWEGDRFVSRVHALVISMEGEVFIVDLCSTNGLGNQHVLSRWLALHPGLTVRLTNDTTVSWAPHDLGERSEAAIPQEAEQRNHGSTL